MEQVKSVVLQLQFVVRHSVITRPNGDLSKKKKQDRMVLDMTEIPAEIISVKCFGVLLSKHMPNMHAATTDIHSRLATIHTVELGIPSIHIYYDLSLTQSQ